MMAAISELISFSVLAAAEGAFDALSALRAEGGVSAGAVAGWSCAHARVCLVHVDVKHPALQHLPRRDACDHQHQPLERAFKQPVCVWAGGDTSTASEQAGAAAFPGRR